MKKICIILSLLFVTVGVQATELVRNSEFEKQQVNIRYSMDNAETGSQTLIALNEDNASEAAPKAAKEYSKKSPGKAFALSLLIPGLGQYYNGDKIKAAVFFGVDVASWVININLHNKGETLTDQFEAFNDAHWIQSRYEDMILWTYGETDDENVDPLLYKEISHHLPSTKTQQYYEMTGKYDQFAWGWDDAQLADGRTYGDFDINNPFPRVNESANVPYSARRFAYEQMRHDANNKFDQARRMIYVSMVNRLISAFEAMVHARKLNERHNDSEGTILSNLSLKASLRSYNASKDTPYLTCRIKF